MQNQKILEKAKSIAQAMINESDFGERKFDFGKLSFKIRLANQDSSENTKVMSFLTPFRIEGYIFTVVSE